VLHYTRLEKLANKHSSLWDSFVSYEEDEVLYTQLLWLYSHHFIFL